MIDWWFAGGTDMTPIYLNKVDAIFFHSNLRSICNRVNSNIYDRFKEECDNYFVIKFRNERRGIGGIFFDDFNEGDIDTLF